ncbi:MAG: metal-dependent transcriptional regulator [Candidatus Bathyarchaeota archaeon]|nr:metal-dependent transcriptional regulator [Candidatus Bathyarchaeota archaeon]MCZ2808457.1 metal-dependent transcriptional regulator [Candidatus Bathyarchaeota archaeon]
MSRQIVSPTVEEYLEQIYRLEKERGIARTKHIAEMVGVSLGTVTNTIDALEQQNLVTHEPYKGVKLTEDGLRIAIDVIRRHRLAERLLTDFLKLDWSRVHEHACKLEHAIVDALTNPLEKALGHPTSCPHGNPIPKACGGILEEASQPLIGLPEGEKGVVAKIVKENQEVLEYLLTINLVPGTPIEVVEKAPLDGPITLLINGRRRPISRKLASIVWVKKED